MKTLLHRGMKFYIVGAAGIGVQLAAAWVLRNSLSFSPAVATAIAVEAAVLHNFAWHEHWTWRERRRRAWWTGSVP